MRFLYDNEFDKYTLTASTETAGYTAANIQDYQLEKTWRSTTVTTATHSIDAGAGLSVTANIVGIANYNFTA